LELASLGVDWLPWQLSILPESGPGAVSVCADDFDFVADPVRRQIYPAAVSTGFNPLLDHFFTVYFKFDLVVGKVDSRLFIIGGILIAVFIFDVWHVDWPLSGIKFECPVSNSSR
jgi:hypothetical protein